MRGMRSLGPTAVSASSISRFLGLGACALAAAGAKSKPRKVSFASAGVGSGSHMAGELFKMMAGVDIVHVPYRGGGPALTDLLGGQVQLMFPGTIAAIEYIKAGTLRPLAVTTATRAEVLPNLPTVSDFVEDTSRASSMASERPKILRWRSSRSSTGRSMQVLPTRSSGSISPTSAARFCLARQPTMAG